MSYSKYLLTEITLQKIGFVTILSWFACGLSFASKAQDLNQLASSPVNQMQVTFNKVQSFASIYANELGKPIACKEGFNGGVKFCFEALRNDGNAPFILLPKVSPNLTQVKGVIVLFHGLSDSPYFMSSIGEFLRSKGYIVIAPLTPGHGKIAADADMQDEALKMRWLKHTKDVMAFANEIAETEKLPVAVGGFSTGGAFATYYAINHPEHVDAILLFSGALELSGSAETMSNIWGMKSLAKWLDGEYKTDGGHPFKYPSVASYAGLVLMDVIHDIRDILEAKKVAIPIFSAHSMSDKTTLFSGVERLTNQIKGDHRLFKIDESYDLCHADVPMSAVQIVNLKFDKSKVNASEKCVVPKANPLHNQMLLMLDLFLNDNLTKK